MKISYRLYLTVTPAILGVLLMAGLFYWGQYDTRRPRSCFSSGPSPSPRRRFSPG